MDDLHLPDVLPDTVVAFTLCGMEGVGQRVLCPLASPCISKLCIEAFSGDAELSPSLDIGKVAIFVHLGSLGIFDSESEVSDTAPSVRSPAPDLVIIAQLLPAFADLTSANQRSCIGVLGGEDL